MKQMADDFERVQGNQKRVMAQLREINVDALKMELTRIDSEMTKKIDVDKAMKQLVDFNETMVKVSKTVSEVEKESNNTAQYTNRRIEGNRDILMKNEE